MCVPFVLLRICLWAVVYIGVYFSVGIFGVLDCLLGFDSEFLTCFL